MSVLKQVLQFDSAFRAMAIIAPVLAFFDVIKKAQADGVIKPREVANIIDAGSDVLTEYGIDLPTDLDELLAEKGSAAILRYVANWLNELAAKVDGPAA